MAITTLTLAPSVAATASAAPAAPVEAVGGPVASTPSAFSGATPVVVAQVSVTPDSSGMPGAALIRQMLNWLAQLALWGSLASILAGAAIYGIAQNTASYSNAYRGKQLAAAGAIGAILAGLAPTVVNLLFNAAR